MQRRLVVLLAIAALCLSFGVAGAAVIDGAAPGNAGQILLGGGMIPKWQSNLPLLEFEFINGTSVPLPLGGAPLGVPVCNATTPPLAANGCSCVLDLILDPLGNTCAVDGNGNAIPDMASPVTPFAVDAVEFQSQILPAPDPLIGWPPAGVCANNTASWTFGYKGPNPKGVDPVTGFDATYLGPVVIAETGVETWPVYGNALPMNGNVQMNLPIDRTLDWADPTGVTGPDPLCVPDPVLGGWTNPLCGTLPYIGEMPIATHLHGGEVPPAFDGGPDAWFTQGNATVGIGWPGSTYMYPNNQQESLIWFHDHALGITRLNVYAGLAGIQPIVDLANPPLITFPSLFDGYDIPLIIQDRSFDTNCDIFYNLASNPQPNPTVHPFWIPEFIGDTIAVNGKTWPVLHVEPRQYRFRLVNGSNARMYELQVFEAKTSNVKKIKDVTKMTTPPVPFLMIATDDGYLDTVQSTPMVVLGNGERYEYVMDFTPYAAGVGTLAPTNLIMMNSARTPYPGGAKPVKGLTDEIMLIVVDQPLSGVAPTTVAAGQQIRATNINRIATGLVPMTAADNPNNPAVAIHRQLTLNEVIGPGGPLELVVNNSKFNLAQVLPGCTTPLCRESEMPAVGDTEIWEIINITADAHPMHTHLTSFQVLDRTPMLKGGANWIAAYDAQVALAPGPGMGPPFQYNLRNADGAIGGNPAISAFLDLAAVRLPLPYEQGWKDTVITYPGEVTRIAVRWAPTDVAVGAAVIGTNDYANFPNGGFNPMVLAGDPTVTGPTGITGSAVGYVWHCHIVDHEDNEMMRNYVVGSARQPIL